MSTTIDLTTPEAALAWLRSLPAALDIELPGHGESARGDNDVAASAVRAITSQDANSWASDRNRWIWTAGELLAALPETAPC